MDVSLLCKQGSNHTHTHTASLFPRWPQACQILPGMSKQTSQDLGKRSREEVKRGQERSQERGQERGQERERERAHAHMRTCVKQTRSRIITNHQSRSIIIINYLTVVVEEANHRLWNHGPQNASAGVLVRLVRLVVVRFAQEAGNGEEV